MLKLPRCLRVIESWGVSGKLELFHHLLRPTVLAFEQKRHENFELDDLRSLILVATRRLLEKSFETVAGRGVILLLEWNLSQIVLGLTEFRIDLQGFLEGRFCFVVFLLFHQNFAAQI